MKLLVVCLGNICRSPMAEGALRARIEASPLAGRVQVDSVGTGGWQRGEAPDPRAIATAAAHGVDIAGLKARSLGEHDFYDHDWLLCADAQNLRDVRQRAPTDARAQPALLLEWAGLAQGAQAAIPDPYLEPDHDFEGVWQRVDSAAQAVVVRLMGEQGWGILQTT